MYQRITVFRIIQVGSLTPHCTMQAGTVTAPSPSSPLEPGEVEQAFHVCVLTPATAVRWVSWVGASGYPHRRTGRYGPSRMDLAFFPWDGRPSNTLPDFQSCATACGGRTCVHCCCSVPRHGTPTRSLPWPSGVSEPGFLPTRFYRRVAVTVYTAVYRGIPLITA
jgi:hypothetical protein